jgi:flagellar motor switch protein FliM
MNDPLLSQEAVDALLDGVAAPPSGAEGQSAGSGVRDFDLTSRARVLRGCLPTLDRVSERFAHNVRAGLFNLVRRGAEVAARPVRVLRYAEFLDTLALPASLNVIALSPLRGTGLVVFDATLVLGIVDILFGGSGRLLPKLEGRDFSPAEQRIIRRLVDLTLADYATAWEPLYRLAPAWQRSEVHRQFVAIAAPEDRVVTAAFDVGFGSVTGAIHICLPYASLDPIRDLLSSPLPGDSPPADRDWLRQLTEQVQSADVELTAELAHKRITIGQLLKLKVGDIIDLPVHELITAHIGGLPVIDCRFGTVNGRAAIRVERVRKYSQSGDPQRARNDSP